MQVKGYFGRKTLHHARSYAMRKIQFWTVLLFASCVITSPLWAIKIQKSKRIELRQIFASNHEITNPTLSPSGSFLAYTKSNFHGLYIYDFKKKKTIIASSKSGSGHGYSWAPGAFRIVYRTITLSRHRVGKREAMTRKHATRKKKYGIHVYDLINKKTKTLYESFSPAGLPVWSSNGSRIFILVKHKGHTRFRTFAFVYDRNEDKAGKKEFGKFFYPTRKALLIGTNGGEKIRKVNPIDKSLRKSIPSPNKRLVVWESKDYELYVSDINGNNVKMIGRGTHPRWNKTSSQIAYTHTNNPINSSYSDIYVYNTSTGKNQRLTNTNHAMEIYPLWSHSGKNILHALRHDNGLYIKRVRVQIPN